MRQPVYAALEELAERRGVALANLVDTICARELRAEGFEIPDYIPPAKPKPRARSTPKLITPVNPPPPEVVAEAIEKFNALRLAGKPRPRQRVDGDSIEFRAAPYDPPRPLVELRGSVQSQHLEF